MVNTTFPSGTVTFLFTDIEGSTRLLQQLGSESYAQLLVDHRTISRSTFRKYGGTEIDTQGDSFFVSFPRATEGVAASAEIQRVIAEHTWPKEVHVQVRMGLHTGEPWLIEEGYVGTAVHRAARIAHVGHGGQILLSETTTALVIDELPENFTLLDLGRHLLKDMHRPEQIRQLVVDGLPADFPLLNSLERLPPAELREPRQVGESPYRGLAAFREADAPFFYGRESFVQRLLTAVKTQPLVSVIVGSSGSGKSSVVFAGLIPQLHDQGTWQMTAFRPGNQPFHALGATLLPLLEPGLSETGQLAETGKLAEHLIKGEVSLCQAVERALAKSPGAEQLLLVIDQFEELYTLCPDAEVQRSFIDQLLAAVEVAGMRACSPLVILITIRADFMGHALTHRPFADALQEGSLIMGPMTRQELKVAVEEPARIQGAAFEHGLVERILDDVGDEPGNLPLLEFALTLLWEAHQHGWLTHEAYDEIGHVDGALASYADEVYAGLTEGQQDAARLIFVQLVRPGLGTEDTRRVASCAELGDAYWSVVQHLADKRLVVTGRDAEGNEIVEVVHEALIQRWGKLQEWMEADRAFRTWQERLRASLRSWERTQRDEGALLRGVPLAEAEEWQVNRCDEIGEAECEYIEASVAYQKQRQQARDRRRRMIIGGLVVGMVVATMLSVFAFSQQRKAGELAAQSAREAEVNQSLALAAQSQVALEAGEVDLALALAMEAVNIDDPPVKAELALSEAAYHPGTVWQFLGHGAAIRSAAVSPDGRFGLSGDDIGVIYMWDLATRGIVHRLEGHTGRVVGLAFTPDGRHAVSGSYDQTVVYWDLDRGEVIRQLTGLESEVNTIALSPDGRSVAAGSGTHSHGDPVTMEKNFIDVWDLPSGEHRQQFTFFTGSIADLAFSADGQQLTVGTHDGDVIVLEIETGQVLSRLRQENRLGAEHQLLTSPENHFVLAAGEDTYDLTLRDLQTGEDDILTGHHGEMIAMAMSPEGQRLLSGSLHEVIEWDLESREPIQQFNIKVSSLAYHPDGQMALMGSEDNILRLVELDSGAEIGRLPAGQDDIRGAAYSPDGQTILTNDTWSISNWDLATGDKIWDGLTYGSFREITISPDGEQFLTSRDISDFGVLLWDTANGEVLKGLVTRGGHSGAISSVAFHPGGQFALSGSEGGTTLIYWDLAAGIPVWLTESGSVLGVAISPDGQTALSSERDGAVKWWKLETGELIRPLAGHANSAWSVAFVDNQKALSASEDGVLTLWDLENGTAESNYLGHTSGILRVAVNPDQRLALSASRDGTLILWDIEKGEALRRYTGHTGELHTVAWHPDGGEAISGGVDRQPIRWRIDADLDALLAWIAENRYVRELTCVERQAFRIGPSCEDEAPSAQIETFIE